MLVNWHITDHLGSVTAVIGADGTVDQQYQYNSYGELRSSAAVTTSRFMFTGREFDVETWSTFYRSRYYDHDLGRFMTEDPIRFESGDTNLFRYVDNAPNSNVDPFGQVPTNIGSGLIMMFPKPRKPFPGLPNVAEFAVSNVVTNATGSPFLGQFVGNGAQGAVYGAFFGAAAGGIGAPLGAVSGFFIGLGVLTVSDILMVDPIFDAVGDAIDGLFHPTESIDTRHCQ